MQLFLTDFVQKDMSIVIENPVVLEQLKKVLRMKKGDVIAVQSIEATVRYVVHIDDWDHKCVYGTITDTILVPQDIGPSVTMYVAMPNKRDKAELIVQKLAELGVQKIIFWRAERSILREKNEKKVVRIQKIMQEAVEQSRGWHLPIVEFMLDTNWTIDVPVVIFDVPNSFNTSPAVEVTKKHGQIGVVGPEGGLTERDYGHFSHYIVYGLGNAILRMETAAIVGAYELCKN